MTTAFSLDLNTSTLTFGSIAEGQIIDLSADINMRSEAGSLPISGRLEGHFIGEIKNTRSIPITIPHKSNSDIAGFNIIIVGTGGTGGYLIRDLARFIYALKEKGDTRPLSISLVDGDIVEEKNVLRQNFTRRDIGKPKAEVLARRYSNAFGLEIEAITEMLNSSNVQGFMNNSRIGGGYIYNIIVGCVDNHKARRSIANHVRHSNNIYWVDSGNETKSGQVVLGFGQKQWSYNKPERNTDHWMPNVTHLYPEILDSSMDEVEATKVSCAERSMVDTQNIFINMTAAGHVLNFIRQIVMKESITVNCIEFNTKGITSAEYLTDGHLTKIHKECAS